MKWLLAAGLLALGVPAHAQMGPSVGSDYDSIYGPIQDVELSDLVFGVAPYDGRGVRTKGRLTMLSTVSWAIQEGTATVEVALNAGAASFLATVRNSTTYRRFYGRLGFEMIAGPRRHPVVGRECVLLAVRPKQIWETLCRYDDPAHRMHAVA